MGKKAIKITILLIMATLSMETFAQTWTTTDQTASGNEVIIGSTYKYRVIKTGTNTLTFNVKNSGGTAVLTVDDASLTEEVDGADTYKVATIPFSWGGIVAGDYTIEVVERNTSTSCTNTVTMNIKIIDNSTIANWSIWPNTNCSVDAGNTLTYKVKCTNGEGPWTIKYYITEDDDAGTTHPTSSSQATTAAGDWNSTDEEVTIVISNYKVAKGQGAKSVTLTITEVKDKYGVLVNSGDYSAAKVIQINQIPATSTIQHD